MRRSNSEPHIPVFDKSARRDDIFERSAFTFDHEDDSYICPASKRLRQRQKVYREDRPLVDENGMLRYRASKLDRDACALKPRCCPTPQPARQILRSVHEQVPSETVEGGESAALAAIGLASLQFVSRSISTSDSSVIAELLVRKVGSTVVIR